MGSASRQASAGALNLQASKIKHCQSNRKQHPKFRFNNKAQLHKKSRSQMVSDFFVSSNNCLFGNNLNRKLGFYLAMQIGFYGICSQLFDI